MKLPEEIKILVCETDKESNNVLENILHKNKLKSVLLTTTPERLKWMVATHKPDLIVTDDILWEDHNAIDLIKELRQANNIPLVIWTNNISEKILAAVFNIQHVYFIKKTADENMLMQTLFKTIQEEI